MKQAITLGYAQLNFIIGDFTYNAKKIADAYLSMCDHTDYVVFTELALSGYYPQDLLERSDFLARQDQALQTLQQLTVGKRAWMVLGGVQRNTSGIGKPLYNGLWVVGNGLIQGTYQKRLLPTYNIFDERRHFEPGQQDLIIERDGVRTGFLICEDLWNDDSSDYSINPVLSTVCKRPDLLISINASPSHAGKRPVREKLMRDLCSRHSIPLFYVNQVGAQDNIIFDGASFFCQAEGAIVFRGHDFQEDFGTVSYEPRFGWKSQSHREQDYLLDEQVFDAHAVLGLRDYLSKQGISKVVVGSSGGIDSALTLAIAAKALGAENVFAITMPSKYSSDGSVSDSEILCKNLGVKLMYRPIETGVQEAVEQFEQAFGETPSTLTIENIQARIRGRILMEYSNHFGALVLSTGNKSEMSVGYATLYGDMNGGINLIGDLYKMEVYALSKYINAWSQKVHGCAWIPQAILDKEPSAELRPGQRDQDSLPPYPILDAILRQYVEAAHVSDAQRKIDATMLKDVPSDVISEVLRKVDKAEFKRRQAPPIIRMHGKAFGVGRQVPIVHRMPPNL
jgi:NAD+ synthetase